VSAILVHFVFSRHPFVKYLYHNEMASTTANGTRLLLLMGQDQDAPLSMAARIYGELLEYLGFTVECGIFSTETRALTYLNQQPETAAQSAPAVAVALDPSVIATFGLIHTEFPRMRLVAVYHPLARVDEFYAALKKRGMHVDRIICNESSMQGLRAQLCRSKVGANPSVELRTLICVVGDSAYASTAHHEAWTADSRQTICVVADQDDDATLCAVETALDVFNNVHPKLAGRVVVVCHTGALISKVIAKFAAFRDTVLPVLVQTWQEVVDALESASLVIAPNGGVFYFAGVCALAAGRMLCAPQGLQCDAVTAYVITAGTEFVNLYNSYVVHSRTCVVLGLYINRDSSHEAVDQYYASKAHGVIMNGAAAARETLVRTLCELAM